MNTSIKSILILFSLIVMLGCGSTPKDQDSVSDADIDKAWQEGKTLPSSVFEKYPLPLQSIGDDNGINVMVDLVHQCKFVTMWGLPKRLNDHGYRAIGNQASINTVLIPDGESRIRVKWDIENRIYPFAWHPNFSYNVIITNQSDPNAQDYLPEEQKALEKFVKDGGGLIIFATPPKTEEIAKGWSLNELSKRFEAQFTSTTESYRDKKYSVLNHSNDWEVIAQGKLSGSVHITRKFGKGYVSLIGHDELLQTNRKDPEEEVKIKNKILISEVERVSVGKEPVGGEPRYPISGGGGGGIYPELEKQFNDVVLFYAANQKAELIKTVDEDIPKAKELVESWLPSLPTLEPMYLILSSGGGGGWAVNAFKPKENGIISLSPSGILSIFAHELAHTMHGPVNDAGNVAGIAPIPNRGEAHAGWFQGKVVAWFDDEKKEEAVKNCNSLFSFDTTGSLLDLVTHYENDLSREKWGKGKDWTKTWWIWQKLDDRYGPTWYPRWKYVQHTRWEDDPKHRLTWDEMAEDMSIAVGEDLFPFLIKAGLSLTKERFEKASFKGEEIMLEIAPIIITEAGKAKLSAIGDYKLPLPRKAEQ